MDEPSRLPHDRLALVTKVARLYHERGLRQPEIAQRLSMSQARVSRLLKEAVTLGIVRTVVIPPAHVFTDLEEALCDRYGLKDAVVCDYVEDEGPALLSSIGAAAGVYLETTLKSTDRVGISSWSETLLAAVDAMTPRTVRTAEYVVQAIGGVGNPTAQVLATRLASRLAQVTGGKPRYLAAPGVVASAHMRDALLAEPYIKEVADTWHQLTVLIAGLGSLTPSPLLEQSGNIVSTADMDVLRAQGAVGDMCLHFYDADGNPVGSELDERLVGIDIPTLRAVPRRIAVAGGDRKFDSILAAARGGWMTVLITDARTAERMMAAPQ